MITFSQTLSIPAEHLGSLGLSGVWSKPGPALHDDAHQPHLHPDDADITMLLWMLIFSSLSSSCSSFLVPLLFCCGCLLLPACLLFALSRTDPAQKPTRKRIFTTSYIGKTRLKQTGAQKTSFFQGHFSLLKQPFFCTPTCPKPMRKPFLHTYTRESKIAFSKKGPINHPPPPPPPPPSPTLSVGAAFSRSKPQKNLGSVTVA